MNKFAVLSAVSLLAITPALAEDVGRVLAADKAASGGGAWEGKATLEVHYAYSGQGLSGTTSSLQDLSLGRFVDSFDTPPESGASGYDGKRAWLEDTSGEVTYQEGGDTPMLSVNEGYRDSNAWWRADRGGAVIVSLGNKTDGGASYDVLTVTPRGGKPFDAWFDAKSHLLALTVEVQGPQKVTTSFSDYRKK